MDTIDVIIARALTPEQSILDYEAIAQQAATEASSAVSDAANALSSAEDALSAATSAANELETILSDISSATQSKIDDLNLSRNLTDDTTYYLLSLLLNQDETNLSTIEELLKLYKATGANNDGTMTQKAITDALSETSSSLTSLFNSSLNSLHNTITGEIATAISHIPSGGGEGSGVPGDITSADSGQFVSVAEDGTLTASGVMAEALVNSLIYNGLYVPVNSTGVEIDYVNKTVTRRGSNEINNFKMFTKRKRVIVNDEGKIIKISPGESEQNGSLGQVMVYQPKFYYMRLPLETFNNSITKEIIYLSDIPQAGFKIHPLFVDENDNELDYVLISAYEGCAQIDSSTYDLVDSSNINFNSAKLASIINAKPISGVNKEFTLANATKMAQNRGTGWDITNLYVESCNQMLMLVEYCTFNIQNALGKGVTEVNNSDSYNCSVLTGSTMALNDQSYSASLSIQTIGSTTNRCTSVGQVAVSYRGMENPYGNTWRMIGNFKLAANSRAPIINNFELEAIIPTSENWISKFGVFADEPAIFLPSEAQNANSSLPIGDYLFATASANKDKVGLIGGSWSHTGSAGPFCYAFDIDIDGYTRRINARLMHIPTYNSATYNYNVNLMSEPIYF